MNESPAHCFTPPPPPARSPAQQLRLAGLRLAGQLYRQAPASGTPRSLLLIRPDHLGDVLFLTPALRALRQALPSARITLLVGPWAAGLVRGNPDADAVLECAFPAFERRLRGERRPRGGALDPYRRLGATARQLRPHGFDCAVVLRFDHWWGAWLAAAAGIPRRVGYDWPETRPFLTQALPYQGGRHEVAQNATLLAALAPAGLPPLGEMRYDVPEEAQRWAAGWLEHRGATGRPLVAIHAGAGAAVKQWPAERWAEVAATLASETGATLLLTGSEGERERTAAVATRLPSALPLLDATGQTTLAQLAALLAQCALVLGSDCGPLHLATAVGTPTVHLYGPASADKFGPWGAAERHVVLRSGCPCAPCHRLDWPVAELPAHRCMADISSLRVLAAARPLLQPRT